MNNQHSKVLSEGLRSLDLKDLVYPIMEIDSYKSKMGDDRDVCVIKFTVKDRSPANDLMEFIEKSFDDVLDADISSGEDSNGEYAVFVELERSPKLIENIENVLYGVRLLTGIKDFKFKYHKSDNILPVKEETLKNVVPFTPQEYDGLLVKVQTEEFKKFFNKTLMDDLTINGDIITIHKPFDQHVQLKLIKESDSKTILEEITDTVSVDDAASSEMFWLTKVMGDYNITKFGENFLFTNGNKSMLLKRV